MRPSLQYEKLYWDKGHRFIAGIDEVGRGAFAGPLVTAAVVFPASLIDYATPKRLNIRTNHPLACINDSKLLSPRLRFQLDRDIKNFALAWSIGTATTEEINHHGIARATYKAMRRAIHGLRVVDFVLIDMFYIPYLKKLRRKKQLAIPKGDRLSLSISSASILAKVHRDFLMTELAKRFPQYLLAQHKGYGTLAHRQAIKKYGPTSFHRKQFISKYL